MAEQVNSLWSFWSPSVQCHTSISWNRRFCAEIICSSRNTEFTLLLESNGWLCCWWLIEIILRSVCTKQFMLMLCSTTQRLYFLGLHEMIENLKISRALHFFMSSLLGERKEHDGVACPMITHLSSGSRAEAKWNYVLHLCRCSKQRPIQVLTKS